ncbi:hypothetical protein PC116_g21487 [Phytophthora cactorum]|uniref:Alcohol dehydrogenase-like C-terminal domain-containing protein n=1 Tax=Phytophthora cactorum TaxID=29920 RepID=A0A329SJS6_9STRA|nr:hypothetical protein PC116_g21487 [Phytophthora cactorum]RAW37074.1 hypothetical protein PC110_g6636 [Phytophthora cactorum]
MHEYAFKIPENLPSDVAAPLLCAGTTVFRPLKEAGVKPGKRVSIVGIGGLGHLAIQFAKAMGADAVVAVSRSPNKEKDVRDLGATDSMPYTLFLSFLAVRGSLIMVGLPTDDVKFSAFGVVAKGTTFGDSNIGSIQDIKDMLEVASKTNVRAVIQKLPVSKANEGIKIVGGATVSCARTNLTSWFFDCIGTNANCIQYERC